MTVRIHPTDGLTTQELLGAILQEIRQDHRCSFLCAPGSGGAVIQRVRVALSRVRAEMERQKKPIARFNIRHSVHPETHDGRRYDCVVVWREIKQYHVMTESLEDLLERRA